MINKKGFTLSEVMVAIGVLGVLAALLVPAIMSNAPDNNKIMFKKAYSTLERTVDDLINDDVNYPEDGTGAGCVDGTSGATVNCGFNTTSSTNPDIAGKNKFCYLVADKLNTVSTADCTTIDKDMDNWNFTTTDGIKWKFTYLLNPAISVFTLGSSAYGERIVVDVNGDKKPNCTDGGSMPNLCDAGVEPDQFVIGVRYDGKLNLYGTAGPEILENPTNNQK